MSNTELVFALNFTYWDDPPGSNGTNLIAKPTLEAFRNAALAASSLEGLSILEGDLWFFAADGSPLEAVFSEQPYVDAKRNRYFAGTYSLQAGRGQNLREIISERCPFVPLIVLRGARSDEAARKHGWSNVEEMKVAIENALEDAVPGPAKSVEFELFD